MEKIYMEENNNRKKKNNIVDFSVVLSFVVAIFAVFSLVALGFDQISYAAPVTGDSFTFYKGESDDEERPLSVTGFDAEGNQTFAVPLYYSDAARKNPIFCIEHMNQNTETGVQYNKGKVISDYGLLYLLNNSYVNEKQIVTGGDVYAEAWVTQVAIWVYLSDINKNAAPHTITADTLAKIKATTSLDVTMMGYTPKNYGVSLYDKYVAPLVTAAKNASNLKKIDVSKANDDIAKTTDGKFYQTAAISVVGNPADDLINYDIKLTGISGAIAVDETGKELATTNVARGTKFYVRIPADKVTTEAQTLSIGITGHFNTLTGHEYSAASGSYQKIVSVTGATMDVAGGISIEVVGAPDTGMSTAQTIYFIGLIVLLCGVGIIYANAKPVENQ